jgi:hypothetical protein
MHRHRRWLRIALGVAVLGTLLLVPLPYPPTLSDKEAAVTEALAALLQAHVVNTTDGTALLHDTRFVVAATGRVYFLNEVRVPDSLFLSAGLKPVPSDRKLNVNDGDVIVKFAFTDTHDKRTWYMQFSYIYGNVGGEGYAIRMYKSFWTRRFVYKLEWVA